MALLPIIETPDPRLRTISAPVEAVTEELRGLIADMFETMYAAQGIGLAAIQVGVPKRLLVIDLQEEVDAEDKPVRTPRVFINPEIVSASEDLKIYSEGCLSVPEMFADVERPARVRLRWMDEQGQSHEEELNDLLSTCIQHEMDHLNGVLFIDHLSRLKRDMLLRKLEKLRRLNAA